MTDTNTKHMREFALDASIAFEPLGYGRLRLRVGEDYWNYSSAYGGWLAAVAGAAIQQESGFRGEIISCNIQFMAPVKTGEVTVVVKNLTKRRTIDFWRVSILSEQNKGSPLVAADLITGQREVENLVYHRELPRSYRLEDAENVPRRRKNQYLGYQSLNNICVKADHSNLERIYGRYLLFAKPTVGL